MQKDKVKSNFEKIELPSVDKVERSISVLKEIELESYEYLNSKTLDDELFLSPNDNLKLINEILANDYIKKVAEKLKFSSGDELIDISLVNKGRDEEEVYVNDYFLLKNICRGNSFLFNNQKLSEGSGNFFKILRKGMRKFCDLQLKFVTLKDESYKRLDICDSNERKTRRIIFSPVMKAFRSGSSIKIYKMVKVNGENAQISFCSEFDSWIICSKNVAMLVKSQQDLDYYSKNGRYIYAHAIGLCWFGMLENFSESALNSLKKFLDTNTFVGEYVGNQYCQHLVRYVDHTILFYSIVEKCNSAICLPIEKSLEIFNEYGLKLTAIELVGEFNTYENLCSALESIHFKVAESSIITEEEGSVLYLCKSTNDEVLSVCKLKTFEYKVYRKLREKLSNYLIRNVDDQFKINQFFEEIRAMLVNYELPMPLEFYYNVADTAFEFIKFLPEDIIPIPDPRISYEENERRMQPFRRQYLDFLETVLKIVDKHVNLKSLSLKSDMILNYKKLLSKQSEEEISEPYIEVFIYLPPTLEAQKLLESSIERTFNIVVGSSDFDDEDYSLTTSNIIVNVLHWHRFRTISSLNSNQFIILFSQDQLKNNALNEKVINSLKSLTSNEKNYLKNPTIKGFLSKAEIKEQYSTYLASHQSFVKKTLNYCNLKDSNIYQINELDTKENIESLMSWLVSKYETVVKKKVEMKLNEIQPGLKQTSRKVASQANIPIAAKILSYQYYSSFVLLYGKYENPFEKYKKGFIKYINAKNTQQEIKEYNLSLDPNHRTLIVLMPITIPGTGKTSFVDSLEKLMNQNNVYFFSVSSDKIRLKLMNNEIRKGASKESAFNLTGKYANKEFERELRGKVDAYMNSKSKVGMLFIDKNHPPNAISRSME